MFRYAENILVYKHSPSGLRSPFFVLLKQWATGKVEY